MKFMIIIAHNIRVHKTKIPQHFIDFSPIHMAIRVSRECYLFVTSSSTLFTHTQKQKTKKIQIWQKETKSAYKHIRS